MRELHLFSGIGGGILGGMLLGHHCVGAVEIDAYCRQVLRARQLEGCLPAFPIHDDIKTFDGRAWRGCVDVVCGGFPCQPWSTAGKRKGTADERHLWPEMARVIAEVRPRYVFAENVSLAAFREPWRDLRGLGYRVPPALRLGGCQLGAMYHRHRWWLLAADADRDRRAEIEPQRISKCDSATVADGDAADAHHEPRPLVKQSTGAAVSTAEPDRQRQQGRDLPPGPGEEGPGEACAAQRSEDAADADSKGSPERMRERGDDGEELQAADRSPWRAPTPRLRRLVSRHARGMESRRKRIHALGNAQVPQVAAAAFKILMQRINA